MKVGACRSVIRFDVAWKLTNAYLLPRPTPFLQVTRSVMDKKKIRTLTTIWRLACTQSSSHKEYMVKDATVDFGIQHNSSVAGRTEVAQQQLADESDHGGTLERRSMPSTENKHTIRIEIYTPVSRGGGSRFLDSIYQQKKIEVEREVDIKFQSAKKEDYILIEGNSAESVARASEELQLLINEAIRSPTLDYTHFVSLPLAIHPQLVEKLINFQNSILGIKNGDQVKDLDIDGDEDTSNEDDMDLKLNGAPAPTIAVKITAPEDNESRKVKINNIPVISYPPKASRSSVTAENSPALCELGIDRSIFIKPNTFHLTVLMLKLYNKDLVDAAAKVLKSLPSKVMDTLDGRPVSIRLKGLECMKGSLAKARVLYAPVEEIGGQDRLLRACQVIIDAFVDAGLVIEKDARQKLKLHATVMNARHRKRKKRTRNFDYFDARGIFEKFGSEEWGEYLIREVHLSRRFVFDENGYYQCCASIPFPENMAID